MAEINGNGLKTKIIVGLLAILNAIFWYWVKGIDARSEILRVETQRNSESIAEVKADIRNISSGMDDLKEWMKRRNSR